MNAAILVLRGIDGHGVCGDFIVSDGVHRLAQHGAHEVIDDPDAHNHPRKNNGQRGPTGLTGQAPGAAHPLQVLDEALDDEHEGQRDDRKIVASSSKRRDGDNKSGNSGHNSAYDERQREKIRAQPGRQHGLAEHGVIGKKKQTEDGCRVCAQGHEAGMSARKFSQVSVGDVDTQSEHHGDHRELEHHQSIVAQVGPVVQRNIEQGQMYQCGQPEWTSVQQRCQAVGNPDTEPCDSGDGQDIDE